MGIAIGAGTDVAIGSAGVILASSNPESVLSVIKLSRATYSKMRQNLWWAAGYNLLAVPLAAGGTCAHWLHSSDERRRDPDVTFHRCGCAQRPAFAADRSFIGGLRSVFISASTSSSSGSPCCSWVINPVADSSFRERIRASCPRIMFTMMKMTAATNSAGR